MTTFAPDSPDWFGGATGGVMLAETITLAPDGVMQQGLSGATGLVIVATSAGADIPVHLLVGFTTAFDGGNPIFLAVLTADANPDVAAIAGADVPTYGAGMQLFNADATNPLTVQIFTTNRVITAVHLEPSFLPGRVFGPSGAFVAATALWLAPVDVVANGFASNGSTGVYALASGAGELDFSYLDAGGTQRRIPVGVLVADVAFAATLPLPACIGWFYFTPAADDASGTILVQACAA